MNTTTSHQQYQQFQQKRQQLLDLIHRQLDLVQHLDMEGRQTTLNALEERVRADNFKVLVLGEFKRGKSTFINALLGDEILPAYAKPCTAIINEVKWGDPARALLHGTPSEENLQPPVQEVPVKALEQYVVIQDDRSAQDTRHENPYGKVELFWPLELCRNGVEIIDSPGLNEHDIRQKITMDYLSTVDAILFVLSCEALGSQSELDVIDNTLRAMGHEDIFFVCNRFNLIRPKEQESIRQHALAKLANRTSQGERRVFFIDALGALEGRLAGTNDTVAQSGVPTLERELEKFLTADRGRVKLLRPAMELRNAIQEARRIIPERSAMLRTDRDTLEQRYREAQDPLQRLEGKRQQILSQFRNFREDTALVVGDRAREYYRSLADEIPAWGKAYEMQTPVKFISLEGLKPQVERAISELTTHLSSRMEGEFANWQRSELQPLIQKRLETRKVEMEAMAGDFVEQVDSLRLRISGLSAQNLAANLADDELGQRKVSPLERVLAAAGGFLIGGMGSAGIGAVYGYEEMLKSLIPQIALSAATIFLVGLNPWILIPVMAGGGVIQGFLSTNSTNEKLKRVISEKFAAELRSSSYERANQLADAVAKELSTIETAVDKGLAQELQVIREQATSILQEKKMGEENVAKRLKDLDNLAMSLNAIDQELDALITDVALL